MDSRKTSSAPRAAVAVFLFALCLLHGTALRAQQTVERQDFESGMSPWEEYQLDASNYTYPGDWTIESSGSHPTCTPIQGSYMARFNSYTADSGAEALIASPALDLTGAEVAECRFYMYHDTGSSASDRLYFAISTDGGSTYYVRGTIDRNDGTNGWSEHAFPLGQYAGTTILRVALVGHSSYGNNIFVDDIRITKDVLPAGAEGKDCGSGAECDSGICSTDPAGEGRCRDDLPGHDCIDGNRVAVPAGTVTCYLDDVATCTAADTWSVQSCYDDCGPYLDVHGCSEGQCIPCDDFACSVIGDEGCDPDAWCEPTFGFLGQCRYKKEDGQSCGANKECLSGNCALAPDGVKYCEPEGTCAAPGGSPATTGQAVCHDGDLYTCQGGTWSGEDCYRNCGVYADADDCVQGACVECATSCTTDNDCKQGIPCVDNRCEGNLANGQTCTSASQCQSGNCIDGVCCSDLCTVKCYRCDVPGMEGTCSPVPAGQDPDDECPGQGVCDGTCDGGGRCQYPGAETACDTCARCDGAGFCSFWVAAGTDPLDECPACQACSGTGPGCTPVPAGQDPFDECDEQPPESCGLDGECDGAGNCRLWPEGTPCGQPSCHEGLLELADRCDGQGLCADAGETDCGLYRCADSSSCATGCSSHSHCVEGAFCDSSGTCAPDLPSGGDCGQVWPGLDRSAACQSGLCLPDFDGDGYFCSPDAASCVHDGTVYQPGWVLCVDQFTHRTCLGAAGWSEAVDCSPGPCDAGQGPLSGYRTSGGCTPGESGGCLTECKPCEPYMATTEGCLANCQSDSQCWPGYECRNGQCLLPEGIGAPCQQQQDCKAGWCVDGVCCLEACSGPCRACNLPGSAGLCRMIPAGEDPEDECQAEPQSSCGTTGVCDGKGNCQHWPAGTVCSEAHCDGNVLVEQALCNGAGDCVASTERDCSPGRCEAGACTDTCTNHGQCSPDAYCDATGHCSPDLQDGADCSDVAYPGLSANDACSGGLCLPDEFSSGGAYCASDETGCMAGGTVYPPGYRLCDEQGAGFRTCLGADRGWGPYTSCRQAGFCDAGGGPASGVTPAEQCHSGPTGGCFAECTSCLPYLASEPGVCPDSCTEDAGCWPGYRCEGGSCVTLPQVGKDCTGDEECAGLFCRDGVCCNSQCEGPCRSCRLSTAPGICQFAPAGTDPDDDCQQSQDSPCGQTGVCDGLGACALAAAGTRCGEPECSGGVHTSAALCDGKGECVPGVEHECMSGECMQQSCAPPGSSATDGGDGTDGADGTDGGTYDGPPIAEAGPDQVVEPGARVTLDGTLSRGRNLSFNWQQTSGPIAVELEGASTATPSFTARQAGVYTFMLVVVDEQQRSSTDYTSVYALSGSSGCGCSSGGGTGGGIIFVALLLLMAAAGRRGGGGGKRRGSKACSVASFLAACLVSSMAASWGCGDDVEGELVLRCLSYHHGRNQAEDPFELVEVLEMGWIDELGRRVSVGRYTPRATTGPGLVDLPRRATYYLLGLNQRDRPLSAGWTHSVERPDGTDVVLAVDFMKLDKAAARRTEGEPEIPQELDAYAQSLVLDRASVQSGSLDGELDASVRAWLLWEPGRLWVAARVVDDSVISPQDGAGRADALVVYLADGSTSVASDGSTQGLEPASTPRMFPSPGGWGVVLEFSVPDEAKNTTIPFDLRLIDEDPDQPPAVLTWRFDPHSAEPDPQPDEYGSIVFRSRLLHLVAGAPRRSVWHTGGGVINIEGDWDEVALRLSISVFDEEVVLGGDIDSEDNVTVLLDLANGLPPNPEPLRFAAWQVSAGSRLRVSGGNEADELAEGAFNYTGHATASTLPDGFKVELEIPWSNLGMEQGAQRGWLLGFEVLVEDHDSSGTRVSCLSGTQCPGNPSIWPEILLDRKLQ